MGIRVSHAYGQHLAVAAADGTEILRYVHRPDPGPFESPKPYAHPVRTLAGRTVTGYRPSDQRCHKGLQMTGHLSGQNFWGGNSSVHGCGHAPLNGSRGRRLIGVPRGVHAAARSVLRQALPLPRPGSRLRLEPRPDGAHPARLPW
jgi:hypothetical protein